MEHRAPNAGVLVLAGGAVGAGAGAEFDLAFVEVLLELGPFGVADRAVLVGVADLAALLEVGLVVADDVFVEDGDVAAGDLQKP